MSFNCISNGSPVAHGLEKSQGVKKVRLTRTVRAKDHRDRTKIHSRVTKGLEVPKSDARYQVVDLADLREELPPRTPQRAPQHAHEIVAVHLASSHQLFEPVRLTTVDAGERVTPRL